MPRAMMRNAALLLPSHSAGDVCPCFGRCRWCGFLAHLRGSQQCDDCFWWNIDYYQPLQPFAQDDKR